GLQKAVGCGASSFWFQRPLNEILHFISPCGGAAYAAARSSMRPGATGRSTIGIRCGALVPVATVRRPNTVETADSHLRIRLEDRVSRHGSEPTNHLLACRWPWFCLCGVAAPRGHSRECLEHHAVCGVDGQFGMVVGGCHLDHVDACDVVFVAELADQPQKVGAGDPAWLR